MTSEPLYEQNNDPKTYECTVRLRWQQRAIIPGLHYKQVLQQAWVCREDGGIWWQDVPVEDE